MIERTVNMLDGYSIVTFTVDDKHAVQWVDLLDKFRNSIVINNYPEDQKMIRNYYPDRLVWSRQIAISLLLDKGDHIQGFSSLYHREEFGNACRVLNRLYLHPRVRMFNPRDVTVAPVMIDHQIKALNQNSLFKKAPWVFVSKEPYKRLWCTKLARELTEKTDYRWCGMGEEVHPMIENQEERSCWQHLVFTNLIELDYTPGMELLQQGISINDFKHRFDRKPFSWA